MKKKLFITAIVLLGFINVNAQNINLGAKAGINIAKIIGDDTDWVDMKTSIHLGVVAEIEITEEFFFQPELLYSSQGTSYKDWEGARYTYDGKYKFNYLNIPLLAKYYVGEGISVEAGPQIGFLLSAKDDWEVQSTGETGDDKLKDYLNGIDFGLDFGVAYKLESGLNFGIRYNLGLSNIWENSDSKQKNSVIQVSLGYFFKKL